jgi:hypothetical protein
LFILLRVQYIGVFVFQICHCLYFLIKTYVAYCRLVRLGTSLTLDYLGQVLGLPLYIWYMYQGRQDRVRTWASTWFPLQTWYSLLLRYQEVSLITVTRGCAFCQMKVGAPSGSRDSLGSVRGIYILYKWIVTNTRHKLYNYPIYSLKVYFIKYCHFHSLHLELTVLSNDSKIPLIIHFRLNKTKHIDSKILKYVIIWIKSR